MSKKEVEIVYSSMGLEKILVDHDEMDCDAIKEKIIPAWFKPARDKSGWKGLIPEIQDFLADDSVELAFSFNGSDEFKKMFDRALKENNIETAKLSDQEISNARVESAQKAALTGNYSDAVKNLLVAAQLGRADAMRRLAICFRDGTGTDVDLDAYNDWLRKAAQAGDAEALDLLLPPVDKPAKDEDATVPADDDAKLFEEALALPDEDAVWALKRLATKGYAPAQNELAGHYFAGVGVEEDLRLGVKWLKKAAEQDYAEALDNLGDCYFYGIGVEEDEEKAVELYRQAAANGVASAQYSLGNCYYSGTGIKEDKSLAFQWFSKAAEQEDPDAENMLGMCFLKGHGTDEDNDAAFQWVQKAAKQGLAVAQFNLGYCYANGFGTAESTKKAFEWYQKAAEQNYPNAQNELGDCYCFSIGVDEDKDKAFQYYQKAAEQDNAEAQNMLGRCYQEGWGVEQDEFAAFEWYQKAAKQGLAVAQNNLGWCYDRGSGVEKDEFEAFEWYSKAAAQDDADGLCNVGVDYALGCGTNKDYQMAEEYFHRAMDKKSMYAHYWLAELIYAQNVSDNLKVNPLVKYGHLGVGATLGFLTGGLSLLPTIGIIVAGGAGLGIGRQALEAKTLSSQEKKKAAAFIKTKEGREMMRLYKYAADNGHETAQQKYDELRKL